MKSDHLFVVAVLLLAHAAQPCCAQYLFKGNVSEANRDTWPAVPEARKLTGEQAERYALKTSPMTEAKTKGYKLAAFSGTAVVIVAEKIDATSALPKAAKMSVGLKLIPTTPLVRHQFGFADVDSATNKTTFQYLSIDNAYRQPLLELTPVAELANRWALDEIDRASQGQTERGMGQTHRWTWNFFKVADVPGKTFFLGVDSETVEFCHEDTVYECRRLILTDKPDAIFERYSIEGQIDGK